MHRHLPPALAALVIACALPSVRMLDAQACQCADSVSRTADTTAAIAPPRATGGVKLSGYAEGSFVHSARANGARVVGRLYDRMNDQVSINALRVTVDRPYATDRLDAGLHTDVTLGRNAEVIRSNGLTLGADGDVTQLFLTLNVPTPDGNGLQLRFGKMATLAGYEVIETIANPNWSEGNQFVFVENFTALGVSVEHKFDEHVDAQLRVINGWDVVKDDNKGKSLMGRVGIHPDSATTVGLVGYYGAEEPHDGAKRYGADVVLGRSIGRALSVWAQGDYGREQANAALPDPSRAAAWWALGMWLSWAFTTGVGVALRGDFVDDRNGARSAAAFALPPGGVAHRFGGATATLNLRPWEHALVRPELRYDRSSLAVFDGRRSQVTGALGVALTY